MLAPFAVRSFRRQWPADLATSWAFDMENIILAWYVLVETQSVLMLTLYASLHHMGNLLAPMFGVMGDRIGHRNMLVAMRASYTILAVALMSLAFAGALTPAYVLILAGIMGLVRPSDIGMRSALVAATVPGDKLMGAMALQRTTQDSAKITGALTGATMMAALGIGPAYTVVASLYAISTVLTFKAAPERTNARPALNAAQLATPLRDLREGIAYVCRTPLMLAAMIYAFLLNCTAFPMMGGLMPVLANQVYHTDQTGLGYLVATGGAGALVAAVIMSRVAHRVRPAYAMMVFSTGWYLALICLVNTPTLAAGLPFMLLAGLMQGMGQIAMATMILRNSDERLRGRVMGIRMLAIYGNVPGLLLAGWLVPQLTYPVTATLYGCVAMLLAALIFFHWRDHLLRRDAPANSR